jgi:propionyl-CoA carboxylase alpha chain
MHHDAFRSGNFDTKFVEKYFKPEVLAPKQNKDEEIIAAVLGDYLIQETSATKENQIVVAGSESKWRKNRL